MSTTVESQYSSPRASGVATPSVGSVAIFGAGRVGTVLARALVEAGLSVHVVGPRGPEDIRLIVDVVAPGANASEAAEAVVDADVVILAVPLHKVDSLDSHLLEGKIVVDVMNYWEPIDGHLPEFADATNGTSPIIASKFPGARIVKAFNHIGYHDIESDRRDAESPDRRALAVASDDDEAALAVMSLVDAIGFDALDLGPLSNGVVLEAGGGVFGVRLGKERLAALIDEKTTREG